MLPSLLVMLLLSMLPEFDVLLGEVLSGLAGRGEGPRVRESKLPGFMEPSVALGGVVRSAGFWVGVPLVPGVASEGVVDCA